MRTKRNNGPTLDYADSCLREKKCTSSYVKVTEGRCFRLNLVDRRSFNTVASTILLSWSGEWSAFWLLSDFASMLIFCLKPKPLLENMCLVAFVDTCLVKDRLCSPALPLLGFQPLTKTELLDLLLRKEEYEQHILYSLVIYHFYIHYRVSSFLFIMCTCLTIFVEHARMHLFSIMCRFKL
jgi:hypothetical protein